MNITSVKYITDDDGKNCQVTAEIYGQEYVYIPLDPANRHYAEILRQVEAGTLTIQEAN
jgi:hypothetical protein|tara:strand:+ start:84 stop:260 length:177 start_codon:yes stop_codon:yes gene_type:complete